MKKDKIGEWIVKGMILFVIVFAIFTVGRFYETGLVNYSRCSLELEKTGTLMNNDEGTYYYDNDAYLSAEELNNLKYLSKVYGGFMTR